MNGWYARKGTQEKYERYAREIREVRKEIQSMLDSGVIELSESL